MSNVYASYQMGLQRLRERLAGHPRLVEAETLHARLAENIATAQERRRNNQDQAPRNTKRPYLLRRRVTCGACGLKMKAFSNGEYTYYNCPVGTRRHTDLARTCGLPVFRAGHVDFTVWSWLEDLLTDEARLLHKAQANQAEQEKRLRPWRERLAVIDDLLTDNRRQLTKLL